MAKAAAKAKPVPKQDVVEFFDVEQGSEEWFELRLGLPTTSNFASVMAEGDGKMRDDYMRKLAGEIITGDVNEKFRSEAMDRGRAMEQSIREHYERMHLVDVEPVGFVRRTCRVALGDDFVVGCSPDAKIAGKQRGLEIKSMRADLLIALKKRGAAGFPAEHRAQCQGTMFVCDWYEVDLYVAWVGRLDTMSAKFTVERDEAYIKRLRDELERFSYELQALVKDMRKLR